jgi:hypothetical protein
MWQTAGNSRWRLVVRKLLPVLGGILVAGLVVGVLAGMDRLPVASQEGEGGTGQLRWLNVVVDLPPEGSPVRVEALPGAPHPVVVIFVEREPRAAAQPSQQVNIDAQTGEVLLDTLTAGLTGDSHAREVESVLDSVRVVTDPPDVWPYVDEPAPAALARSGTISFVSPDPSSGIVIAQVQATCLVGEDCPDLLVVHNGRSQMGIRVDTGEVYAWDHVLPQDREAFERYAASVEVGGQTR